MKHLAIAVITLVSALSGGVLSCGKSEPASPADDQLSNSRRVCAVDQVREYFCDDLLPLEAALPAPEPYSNCPSAIDHHEGYHLPLPAVAVFDSSYTSYIRKRHPPGHSCCYSWCGPVEVAKLEDVEPGAGCNQPLVIRETYCMPTLEAGTSLPASNELPRCPVAIRPPAGKAFAVPRAAPLDMVTTAQRRSYGFDECCYGWCSVQPGGSY